MSLRALRGTIAAAVASYEAAAVQSDRLEAIDFQAGMNLLKVHSSEMAIETVMSSLQACGLSGYRNDGEFSVGRHLRDALSAPLMINNDRVLANIATATLMSGVPTALRD